MAALGKKLRSLEGSRIGFWCPGCDEVHVIVAAPGRWTFDGNVDAPTFAPSILVTGTDFTKKGRADCEAWRVAGCPKLQDGHKFESQPTICHSFVRAGQIQFLGDCTHALANKTVPLPDWPYAEGDYGGV